MPYIYIYILIGRLDRYHVLHLGSFQSCMNSANLVAEIH